MAGSKTKFKPGDKPRLGKSDPGKTCVECGKTKNVSSFPKRGGIYKKYKELDPKRYDTQCKLCKKANKPGQDRAELTEPKQTKRVVAAKKVAKTKKQKERLRLQVNRAGIKYKTRVREETRIQSMLYLADHGCEECGERDPRVLEYDHKEPDQKYAAVSRLIIDGYSWTSDRLRSEIAKCRILCASCHRLHTIVQQDYYKRDAVQEVLGKLSARYKFTL